MFQRLQQKWKVSTKQFWIIFTVFAITGTTTAYLTRAITSLLGFTDATWWVWKLLLRFGMLAVGYWILLLVIGSLFGQYKFFSRFIKNFFQNLGIIKKPKLTSSHENEPGKDLGSLSTASNTINNMHGASVNHSIKNIAIFASGSGSNAEKIIEHFLDHPIARVALVVCNVKTAGVINRAAKFDVPVLVIEKETFFRGHHYLAELEAAGIDFIVLAGFLWKVPEKIIEVYRNRIVNIHPALLPKFGGKGMYGLKVHQAVIEQGEHESGITIHYVDEHYDHGDAILQATCPVLQGDTPEALADRIHKLEHKYYPETIEKLLKQ